MLLLSLFLLSTTQAQIQEYCIDFGRDAPDRGHWLSHLSGSYIYNGEINDKPSWQQTTCTDPNFVNNCNNADIQLSYGSWGWLFTRDGSQPFCDGEQPDQPHLCSKWWGLSSELQQQGYPRFTLGSCENPSDTSSTTPSPTADKKFIINNDPNQHVQISETTQFIENARNLLQCDLKTEGAKYIITTQENYDKIKDKKVLLMNDEVFNDDDLSPECKYPVLKILNEPSPETLDNNQIKIYVTTDVAMTDYIHDIDVDLEELEMVFLDPDHVSAPSENMLPSQTKTPYEAMEGMEFEEAQVEEIEYTMECVENCAEYDENHFSYFLQAEYEDGLKAANDPEAIRSDMIAEQFGGIDDGNRRRLFWSWFKKTFIKPIVRIVKKVVKVVKKVVKTIVQIVTGNVDLTEKYGIDINSKKSNKFTSKYKYKKSNLKADIEGNLDIEYGIKFKLELFSKLKAKWSLAPPKFEQFRFTVGGSTEFLSWVKAQISASADIEMLLFEKKKSFKFMLGPVPVIVSLDANLKLKLETAMNAEFMQQIGYEPLSVEFGIEYVNNEWRSISDINLQFQLINNKQFKWGESDEADAACPLPMNIELYLIPRFQLTLYKMVYAAVEEEFKLDNSYEIGDSCIDGKEICDILLNDDENELGLTTGLDVSGRTNVILGAKIEILGIKIAKKEWRFPINALSFDKHLGETCTNLPSGTDEVFKQICKCPDEDQYICISGLTDSLGSPVNGQYRVVEVGDYSGNVGEDTSRPFNEETDDCSKVWCIWHATDGSVTQSYLGTGYRGFSDWKVWDNLPRDTFGTFSYFFGTSHPSDSRHPGDFGNPHIKKGRCPN